MSFSMALAILPKEMNTKVHEVQYDCKVKHQAVIFFICRAKGGGSLRHCLKRFRLAGAYLFFRCRFLSSTRALTEDCGMSCRNAIMTFLVLPAYKNRTSCLEELKKSFTKVRPQPKSDDINGSLFGNIEYGGFALLTKSVSHFIITSLYHELIKCSACFIR